MRIRARIAGAIAFCIFMGLCFGSSAAAQSKEPDQLINDTFAEAMTALKENQSAIRNNPRVAYDLMEKILAPHVDVELMSRLILARHWTEATPEQQKRFVAAFRESLLRTYSRILSDNVDEAVRQLESDEQILRVLGVDGPDRRGRVSVRTTITFNGQRIPIDYRMYQRDGQWKVFDVLIENISFVMNYRSEYDAELQRGQLDTLIDRIEERNRRAWTTPEAEVQDPGLPVPRKQAD